MGLGGAWSWSTRGDGSLGLLSLLNMWGAFLCCVIWPALQGSLTSILQPDLHFLIAYLLLDDRVPWSGLPRRPGSSVCGCTHFVEPAWQLLQFGHLPSRISVLSAYSSLWAPLKTGSPLYSYGWPMTCPSLLAHLASW